MGIVHLAYHGLRLTAEGRVSAKDYFGGKTVCKKSLFMTVLAVFSASACCRLSRSL